MSNTDQTAVLDTQQPEEFSETLARPYVDEATPDLNGTESTGDVPFDEGAYERATLDRLCALLAAAHEKSGTATRHAVRVSRDFDVARGLVEAVCAELQVRQLTLAEATTAVHSGEPLL